MVSILTIGYCTNSSNCRWKKLDIRSDEHWSGRQGQLEWPRQFRQGLCQDWPGVSSYVHSSSISNNEFQKGQNPHLPDESRPERSSRLRGDGDRREDHLWIYWRIHLQSQVHGEEGIFLQRWVPHNNWVKKWRFSKTTETILILVCTILTVL